MTACLVVLASGSGTLLQALMDACDDGRVDAEIVAVGSDVADCTAVERAQAAGILTFVSAPADFSSREQWNAAMTELVGAASPDLVVSAGFMRILGPEFIDAFPGRIINTHPALLPAFPGAHAVRDALACGVKVTGCTVHVVDQGVDTGPILAQRAVAIRDDDDEESLHERIKAEERELLIETVSRWIGESA
ncbi:MAG: phosphoribosylglycinamide formyltransferase [Actinomycetes bacterium]